MDAGKRESEQSKNTGPSSTDKALKVKKDTLKDLEPETRDAQHVKGGIPPKIETGGA